MTRNLWTVLAATFAAAAALGCAPSFTTPVPQPPLTQTERNFDAVWRASQDTLIAYYFTVDRQDRRAGVITTLPLTGKQVLEFWRHDAVTKYSLTEDALQTIYRTVKVTIAPTAAGASTYKATVEVLVFRSDKKQPQVSCTSDAYALFTIPGAKEVERNKSVLNYAQEEEGQIIGSKWVVSLGRDPALEARIKADIDKAAYEQLMAK